MSTSMCLVNVDFGMVVPLSGTLTDPDSSLSPLMLQILLALSEGERHGYAIMQEIERRTGGTTEIGAGTLYRSIKQLLDAGFIAEVIPSKIVNRQRRCYGITPAGRHRAGARLEALGHLSNDGKSPPA